jgi:cytochrome c-type biogenesis protein CcmH/NrfG
MCRQFDDALEALLECVTIEPDNHAGMSNLGRLMMDMGDHESAITLLEGAVAIKPSDVEVVLLLGACVRVGESRGRGGA